MQKIKKSFDEVMYEYTEWPDDDIPLDDLNFISDRYFKALEFCRSKDVLEIGAGSSIAKKEISEVSNSYTGIDICKDNILRISEACKDLQISFSVDNAEDMKFDDNSFDVVIALAMVYYLDLECFLKEVKRVLKPNGILFFCTSNKDVPGFNKAPGSKKYLNVYEWNTLLKRHNFSVEFQGSFPLKSFMKLGYRAKVISILKSFFIETFGLSNLWKKLREYSKGSLVKIPRYLADFPKYESNTSNIKDLNDNKNKIIYCKCTNLS